MRRSTINKGRTSMARKTTKSTGRGRVNVFAELGLPNPEQELLKARLTVQINRAIRERSLTQVKAGKILGIAQPHVSSLMRGRAGAFSAERLMEFLAALGHDVEIRLKRTQKEHGEVSVVVAA
jgi:predicted XRE-type DNA-binding protein